MRFFRRANERIEGILTQNNDINQLITYRTGFLLLCQNGGWIFLFGVWAEADACLEHLHCSFVPLNIGCFFH